MNAAVWLMMGLYGAIATVILAHGLAIWREERAAGHWVATRGIVRFGPTRAALARGARPQSMDDITYEYTVAGQQYRSRRLTFDSMTWRSYRKMLAYVAMLRSGSRVTVYYDPRHPQRAVLDRRTSAWDHLSFIVTGVGLLVVGPFLVRLL